MASGRQHIAANSVMAIACVPFSLPIAIGVFMGALLSPDLDTKKSLPMVCTGYVFLPYLWMVPRHRHWSSHWPIVGTALRLLYVFALFFVLRFCGVVSTEAAAAIYDFIEIHRRSVILIIAGLEASACLHYLMDATFSEYKRRF